MIIQQITIHYGLTQNVGDYCNVKPEISLQVTPDPHFDIELQINEAGAIAKSICRELVDDALEAKGKPALYSTEPRYNLLTNNTDRLACIVEYRNDERGMTGFYPSLRNARMAYIQRELRDGGEYAGYQLITPQEAAALDMREGRMWRTAHLLILMDAKIKTRPQWLGMDYSNFGLRVWQHHIDEMLKTAEQEGRQLVIIENAADLDCAADLPDMAELKAEWEREQAKHQHDEEYEDDEDDEDDEE